MHCDPARAAYTRHVTPPLGRRSPWLRLLSQVMELAEGKGGLVSHAERAWASATFAGSRHTITLVFEGPEALKAGERFILALPEHEFAIPAQLVADAAIIEADHSLTHGPRLAVTAELLLLEDSD